jgi:hypothetical protein
MLSKDYLKKNVKGILQPLVKEAFNTKPSNPVNKSLYKFTLLVIVYD